MRYVFSDFVLDGDTRELLRAGRLVPLAPKAFDLLERLLRERPRAVSRTRLRAALWPQTHVSSASLHVLVSQVRAALDDEAQEPRWIRTVQRFGYAFCGSATGSEVGARASSADAGGMAFWLSTTDGDFRLREGDNILGREAGLAARIDRPGVSRRHACIRVEGGRATLTDLGSKNGTFVGNEPVTSPRVLHDGDELRLGHRSRAVFQRSAGEETETEAR
jgi:DNA-binding winged helix-turn-helix (wHTH) protein